MVLGVMLHNAACCLLQCMQQESPFFVASVTKASLHTQYPIYGVQFHPEKNPYEWAPQLAIPHSSDAVLLTHAFARFVVRVRTCVVQAGCERPGG